MTIAPNLRRAWDHNLSTLRRQPLPELSGALGDLGTLLPLMLALAAGGSISLSATLVFSGLANILTGLVFGIPLPVQPMKALAAAAVAASFTPAQTAAAGLFVAGAVGILAVTGLLRLAAAIVPTPVVRGIQAGAGLSLVVSAGTSLLRPLPWTAIWADNLLWALAAALVVLAAHLRPRLPAALLLTVTGFILAAVRTSDHTSVPIHHHQGWRTIIPAPQDWRVGILEAGIPQLPLTLLNSVLATASLASALSRESGVGRNMPDPPSTTHLGLSVSLFNIVGVWFGAMPICHGSGGLAAQWRFGARSGAAVVLLGLAKVILGLLAMIDDAGMLALLRRFPSAILGIMVLAAGVELARVARDLSDQKELWERASEEDRPKRLDEKQEAERWLVMLVTVAGCLAFKNDAVGFAAGMVWHWAVIGDKKLTERGWRWWRPRDHDHDHEREREPLLTR